MTAPDHRLPAPFKRPLASTGASIHDHTGKIFPDQAMTLAAIDRLVHHATILEMNVESYRRRRPINV